MSREFTWNCGASVLVDDAYETWQVKAKTLEDAWNKAMEHSLKSSVLDDGTVDVEMDIKELAVALGNMASEDESEWEPVRLIEELEECKGKKDLICTLESVVCNYYNRVESLEDCYAE